MSTVLIGLENIPNVYITKIKLSDNNTQTFNSSVYLQVRDSITSKGFIWKSDSTFFNHLKVCVVRTNNVNLADSITSGAQSPTPSQIINSPDYEMTETQLYKIPLSEFIKSQKDSDCYYDSKISFKVPFAVENLTVFAFCYQDTQGLSDQFEIDLGGVLKDYFGAITSEKIIENKLTVSSTSLFVQSDNQVWPGPVHLHAGVGYAAGSTHDSLRHSELRELKVQNIKLSDDRTVIYRNKKLVSRKNNTIISDLNYGINKDVSVTGLFSVNFKQFALQKTKYGRDFLDIGPNLFQEFLSSMSINSISIIRQQVKTIRVSNPIGSPKIAVHGVDSYEFLANTIDDSPNNLKNVDNLQQIYLNEDFRIRHYQFFDTEKTAKTKGQFAYKVEISLIDKSQQFINSKIAEYNRNISQLKDLVFFLNSRKRFDYKINQLKSGIEVPAAILDLIRSYCVLKSYFNVMEEFEINNEINQKVASFVNANYTPTTGDKMIRDFETLMTTFLRKFKVDIEMSGTTKPRNNKKAFIPNLVMIEKQFEDLIQFSDYRRFYDYLDLPSDIRVPMSREVFSKRSDTEQQRFFNPDESRTPEEFSTLEDSVSVAITDIKEASSLFMAPLKFNFDSTTVDLKDLSNIDMHGLSVSFLRSKEVSDNQIRLSMVSKKREIKRNKVKANPSKSRRSRPVKRKKAIFFPSFKIPQIKISFQGTSPLVESSDYLGVNSEFPLASGNLNYPAISPISAVVTTLMNTVQIKTGTNKLQFDLKTRDNKLGAYITSKGFKKSKLKKSPLAWKSLVCSRAPSAKNEILSTPGDILQNPETKITTEILYQTSQKLQILSGYDKDINGDDLLSSPIWIDMDPKLIKSSGGTICRMVYSEIPELGIAPTGDFKLPYVNKTFIIADQPLITNINLIPVFSPPASNININTKNKLSDSIKFATTNVVSQNTRKDPFKRRVAEVSTSIPVRSTGTGGIN
tara:strand:- start:3629 stop:6526 length:2898 start_codon:yes stop_codon:yes gene_type:complete